MMNFGLRGIADGSGDGDSALTNRRDKQFQRHTLEQKQQLEEYFKYCPHPNKKQRQQLSEELKLEPQQIKFWFQNRRTQRKTENGRANTDALKLENEKLLKENLAMKEAIINSLCPTCDGLPLKDKRHLSDIQKLRTENLKLRQEHERLSKAAETAPKNLEKPILENQSLLLSMDVETNGFVPLLDCNFGCADNPPSSYQFCTIRNVKKFVVIENVSKAMEELTMLLKINEPVWIESSVYGSYTLHRDNYNRTFGRPNHLKSSTTRTESSKFSGLVAMSALQLLDMFMDPNKWMELFPTLVTNARTIEVIDASMLGDEAGSMQLMYQRMHALSPLVAPREFYFLRYCRQVEPGLFVMADVSHDYSVSNHEVTDLHCWRKPSGCMIKDMSNGYCQVTWVEHVEVDDVSPTHCFYGELVRNSSAYGAQRWILTLQRMIERLAFTTVTGTPNHALEGGIMPEVRSILMDLTHRMIKSFWKNLNMCGNQDFPPLSDMLNDEVQVSVRQNDVPGQPSCTIFSASSSLWLGLSCEALFDFFADEKTRVQWDLFTDESSTKAMVDISFGTHPGNRVSIFQASSGSKSSMFILEESVNDPLGSLIVYAPIHFEWIRSAISGVDLSYVPILPVGFIISGDGYVYNSGDVASTSSNTRLPGGSLLTMFFQMFVEPVSTLGASIEAVATINTIVTSTMNKIKAALNC